MDDAERNLQLPGFRFHPTEEELLEFYLKNIIYGKNLRLDIIGLLDIYHHDPWDLPGLAKIGEREWYFFVPRDRKHANGGRPNRTTKHGFWKATGSDRRIFGLSDTKRIIGLRKTLVFYRGRAPRGCRTDWVMNEYRLPDSTAIPKDIVLCKIYRKATSLRVLEQRAAMDTATEEAFYGDVQLSLPPKEVLSSMDSNSFCRTQQEVIMNPMILKREEEQETVVEDETRTDMVSSSGSSIKLPSEMNDTMFELQVPKLSMDWTQEQLWSQLNSPWFQNLTPIAKLLHF